MNPWLYLLLFGVGFILFVGCNEYLEYATYVTRYNPNDEIIYRLANGGMLMGIMFFFMGISGAVEVARKQLKERKCETDVK